MVSVFMKRIVGLFSLFVLLSFCLPMSSSAQLDAGTNDTINPGVPVDLTVTYGQIGISVDTAYDDDYVFGPYPIGFSFTFFGNKYTQFYIGSNGFVSFSPNPNAKGRRDTFIVPSNNSWDAKNAIFGPYYDFDPSWSNGASEIPPYIYYLTLGQQPARKLVVMWCQVPLYRCREQDSTATFQIILNEGANTIENHIFHKPICADSSVSSATLGVQGLSGFIGYTVPGRNATVWTAERESWLYTPTSVDTFKITSIPFAPQSIVPGNKILYTWYQGNDFIANSQTITVTPKQTTTYHAFVNLCDGEIFKDSVTVVVVPPIPNAFTPNGDGLNDNFRIVGVQPENITKFNFQIYNRWGQMIFYTTNILDAWDGSYKGVECPPGVYVWVIYYEDNKKNKVSNKGTVTLVR
jgi:gliding motility-associated-like protein